MAEYFPFQDSDDDFEYDGRPYLFEPEYTDEELREMEEQTRREREEQEARDEEESRPRINGDWWCCCGHCNAMPTEEESLSCTEWDLRPEDGGRDASGMDDTDPAQHCVTMSEDFPALINRAVVETFFRVPKVNWRRRPKPAGPDGQLSIE